MAIHELIKRRLTKDREMTTITLRIPVDVVDSMKHIAPLKGFSGYQALLKTYISMGLRKDEAEFVFSKHARMIEAFKKRGVSNEIIEQVQSEIGYSETSPRSVGTS